MQARACLQRMPCRRANAQRAHARIAGLAQLYPSALPRTSCDGRLPMQVTMGTHARISRRDVLARTSREDCACSSHEGYACPRKPQGTRLHPALPIREHGGIDAVPAAQTPAAHASMCPKRRWPSANTLSAVYPRLTVRTKGIILKHISSHGGSRKWTSCF